MIVCISLIEFDLTLFPSDDDILSDKVSFSSIF